MLGCIIRLIKVVIDALNRKGVLNKKDNKNIKKIYKEMYEINTKQVARKKAIKKRIDRVSKRIKNIN